MSTRPSLRSRPPAPADDDDADDANEGISARASSYLAMQTGVAWEGAVRAKSGDLGGAALKSTHIWLHPPTWRAFSVQTTAEQQRS